MNSLIYINEYEDLDYRLKRNWENFNKHLAGRKLDIRETVLKSWERCTKDNISPSLLEAPKNLSKSSLKTATEQNEVFLSTAEPVIDSLHERYTVNGLVFVLSDINGTILKCKGDSETLKNFGRFNFSEGAVWSEDYCGTNAIGTALATNTPLTIFSAEHYCEGWHHLVCTAAPVHDPFTGQQLGLIDITGKKEILYAHNSSVVFMAKQMIEKSVESYFLNESKDNPYQTLYQNEKPVIIFNENGRITRYNKLAEILFHIRKEGDFIRKFGLPANNVLKKNKKHFLQYTEDGKHWSVSIHPHMLNSKFSGGVAVFNPVFHHAPQKAKKNEKSGQLVVGRSKAFNNVVNAARQAARYDFPVMINGSTGVGKEMTAKIIYENSQRKDCSFVALNCGAIPKDLIGAELFGYDPGAFTGADPKGKKGKFEMAHKGILFLDEVGELPLETQVYLLRVLEEKKITPIGSNKSIDVDVRIIAATHKNLEEEIVKGTFREDLFYRLQVIQIKVPDVKDRPEDILPLFRHFVYQHIQREFKISPEAQKYLLQYNWPGNVREIKNTAELVVFNLNDGLIIEPRHLKDKIRFYAARRKEINQRIKDINFSKMELPQQITLLRSVLKSNGGNLTKVAKSLGISRMTIYRKLKLENH